MRPPGRGWADGAGVLYDGGERGQRDRPMLTRIEIDGFRTFERVIVDFGPLTALVGPNAAGKSNLLDAIELLSRLAGMDVASAAAGLRGSPQDLFHSLQGTDPTRIWLAVDLLLAPVVEDAWGGRAEL